MKQNNDSGNKPANTNFTPEQLTGTFTATGKDYYQHSQTGLLLKLCERKNPTALKPPQYIVTRSESGFAFISSLYPRKQGNEFTAEYQRAFFTVVIDQDKLIVSPQKSKG